MNELSDDSTLDLPPSKADSTLLPTPFAAAGIGLITAIAFPGGLSGGQGFLLGLAIGLVLSVVLPVYSSAKEQQSSRCPKCGATLGRYRDVKSEEQGMTQSERERHV
ncbi:MAG: prepilin peptidase [Thiobacillus sp.]|nr:prepilin peptidase [Thiobacillus sp.]